MAAAGATEGGGQSRGLAWEEAAGATERGGRSGGLALEEASGATERGGRSGGLAWEEAAGRGGQNRGLSYRMHAAMGPPPPLSGVP